MWRLVIFLLLSGGLLSFLLIILDRTEADRIRRSSAITVMGSPAVALRPRDEDRVRNVTPGNFTDQPEPIGSLMRLAEPQEKELEVRRFPRVVVADSGRLQAGTLTIRLYGVSALERSRTCTAASGQVWPCGERATAALRSLVGPRAVECEVKEQAGLEVLGSCRVGKTDLATWVLRQGWAEAAAEAGGAYVEALHTAKAERRGLWSDGGQARP